MEAGLKVEFCGPAKTQQTHVKTRALTKTITLTGSRLKTVLLNADSPDRTDRTTVTGTVTQSEEEHTDKVKKKLKIK